MNPAKVNQHALENIRLSAQVHTPHASRFIGVGEASFQKLSPIPQQLFPVLAVNAPPVVIHRLPRLRLILPATASTVRFRNIAPNLGLLQRRQRVVAVISLVRHCFDRTFRMDSFPYFFVVRGAGNFGDVLPRLRQGFQNRLLSPAAPPATVTAAPVSRSTACSAL